MVCASPQVYSSRPKNLIYMFYYVWHKN
jgi:hypothetical protein